LTRLIGPIKEEDSHLLIPIENGYIYKSGGLSYINLNGLQSYLDNVVFGGKKTKRKTVKRRVNIKRTKSHLKRTKSHLKRTRKH